MQKCRNRRQKRQCRAYMRMHCMQEQLKGRAQPSFIRISDIVLQSGVAPGFHTFPELEAL